MSRLNALLQRIYKIWKGTKKKSPIIPIPWDTGIIKYLIFSRSSRHIDINGLKLGSYWFLSHLTLFPEQLSMSVNVLYNMIFNVYLRYYYTGKKII